MTVFYGVWLPSTRDAYRREDKNRPPEAWRFWSSDKKSAETKAQHVAGRAILLSLLVTHFERLRTGELVVEARFTAPAIETVEQLGARASA